MANEHPQVDKVDVETAQMMFTKRELAILYVATLRENRLLRAELDEIGGREYEQRTQV